MACKTSYELHHNFAKLAEESGFTFNTHKPRIHVDWNKIRCINVENLVRERKYGLIEQHINDILDCQLESEFDVRILDEGVVKMFHLAQLTVEYQQFCRQYLDRSVYVLRDELTTVVQDLDVAKRDLRDRDDEIRRLKRKTKHNYRPPIMYGHDNIANMILKTLSNNGEMYPTTSLLDSTHQYNKCNYCDKVFLNQLYLKSHMTRRHPNAAVTDMPQKDSPTETTAANSDTKNVNNKLSEEILELKTKLSEMELTIVNFNNTINKPPEVYNDINKDDDNNIANHNSDGENATNSETNLIGKLEEWKKEERDKYSKEIEKMRSQILETINSLRGPETSKANQNEHELIGELHNTIKEQGQQILALKQEITNNMLRAEKEKVDKKNEIEAQMLLWIQKLETQSKQYEHVVQNLNQVAKEAQEARTLAETERTRAARLQVLLEEHTRKNSVEAKTQLPKHNNDSTTKHVAVNTATETKDAETESTANRKPNWMTERKSLKDLHQKAQALLNMNSSSSSSEDTSENVNYTPKKFVQDTNRKETNTVKKARKINNEIVEVNNRNTNVKKNEENFNKGTKSKPKNHMKQNKARKEKSSAENVRKENGPITPRSPVKVVRAKLTEEVNNRLVAAGVDPLKHGIHHVHYNKHRMQLQQEQRLKTKKNPAYENVRHAILAYLDTKAGAEKQVKSTDPSNLVAPTRITKAFSLTSVISNVKNKAMSFVKHNEGNRNDRQSLNADVAKRAIALLKTPPGSAPSTPPSQRRSSVESDHKIVPHYRKRIVTKERNAVKYPKPEKVNKPVTNVLAAVETSGSEDSEEETDGTQSDHKYYDSTYLTKSSKSIENLIKSPVRRPSTATGYDETVRKIVKENNVIDLNRTQSAINISNVHEEKTNGGNGSPITIKAFAVAAKSVDSPVRKIVSEDNILSPKQSKGVLKNVQSSSSLNKKKVLFDLDAIQTKSISASPSQSTEKSDEKYELGLINLDDDEWDISSIDNEPLKLHENDTQLKIVARTSPKIAELKQTIESQLARRNETPSTMLAGSVDVLRGPITRAASIGGSNTSLGSSVFDDTDNSPAPNVHTIKSKSRQVEKDDSELDLSEFSIDGITSNKKRESF